MTKHIPIRVIAILISISAMMLAANPLSNFIQANPTTIVLGFGFLLRIFLVGVADVSLGTVRTIIVFRVYKFLAPTIGFFEIIIWLIAAGQVLGNLDQWHLVIAYAAGFGTGKYVGIWIESRLAMGSEMVRCISYNRDVLADKKR